MTSFDKGFLNAPRERQLLLIYKALLAGGVGGGGDMTVYTDTAAMKAIPTVGITNRAYFVDEAGTLHIWRLQGGTAAEDLPGGIARPDDYVAVTNEKNFVQAI